MIYVASPYTSRATGAETRALHENERAELVARYTAMLIADGFPAVSPIAHGHAIRRAAPGTVRGDAEYWKVVNDALLRRCDLVHVLMLPGWSESVGVTYELREAHRFSKPIVPVVPPAEIFDADQWHALDFVTIPERVHQ